MAKSVYASDSKSDNREIVGVRFPSQAPLELSIVDTKMSAIFSFLRINTTNINDFMVFSTINIAIVVYTAFIYIIKMYTSIQDTRLRVANIKKCLPIKERRVSN